jgi:hypothetical protein
LCFESGASFFPYGHGEKQIRKANLEKLTEMLGDAVDDVREAHFELIQAKAIVHHRSADPVQMQPISRASSHQGSNDECVGRSNDVPVVSSKPKQENEESRNLGSNTLSITDSNSSMLRQRKFRNGNGISNSDRQWQLASSIVMDLRSTRSVGRSPRQMDSGTWCFTPSRTWRKLFQSTSKIVESNHALKRAASMSNGVFNRIIENPTYAVVTFTSRQAAIAARQCQADGCGLGGWKEVTDIPTPPLADAAPMNFWSNRGLMRPVTLTINDQRKMLRRFM